MKNWILGISIAADLLDNFFAWITKYRFIDIFIFIFPKRLSFFHIFLNCATAWVMVAALRGIPWTHWFGGVCPRVQSMESSVASAGRERFRAGYGDTAWPVFPGSSRALQ